MTAAVAPAPHVWTEAEEAEHAAYRRWFAFETAAHLWILKIEALEAGDLDAAQRIGALAEKINAHAETL